MAITPRGMEPANLKKRLDTLFPKLNEAYPDKVIRSLQRDHKKWAETVRELYRALGYPDNESFLKAYGYTVEYSVGAGRPSRDYVAIIEELKKRYPNGTSFMRIDELKEANPDLASIFKSLANKSNELFGMSLADYFISIGLLNGVDHKKQLDELIDELKRRYPADSALPATLAQLKKANADLDMNLLVHIEKFYGCSCAKFLRNIGLLEEHKYHYLKVRVKGEDNEILCAINSPNISEGVFVEVRSANSDTTAIGQVVESHCNIRQEELPCPIESMCQFVRRVSKAEIQRIEDSIRKYLYCSVLFQHWTGGMCEFFWISPFEDIAVDDEVLVPYLGDLMTGVVTRVSLESKKSAPYPVSRTRQIQAIVKKAPRRIPNPTLWNTENTVPFVPDSRFNQFALKIDDRMEIANAVFRGLHTDVTAAIQSLGIYVKKARISDDISEFVIGEKELVMQVMQEFPNLKVAMFVEFFHTSQIHMAYSRSGYPYITDSYYAGDCDLHEEMRWDWKHLPTEKSFRASSLFINTGMRKSVSYCFRYHKDWEAMNYIVLINGSLRQIKEPKPEAKPEFLIDRIGNDCGIIVEYNGKVKDLVWPETYNGLTIVGINLRNVSKQLMAIQILVLPEGYCEVGGFEKCTNLKKVVLPQTLRKIHRKAFSYCKQLEEVVIHDNVRYIGDKAFEGCSALRKFTLPAQLRGGNGSGFSRSLGVGLFKKSGLRELYVNGLESNPSNSNFLEGNKNCVIYAPFGSLFHSDPAYRMRTVAYPLVPLLRVYNKIAPILPRFMGAESRSDYLQIDHNQNAIKNIRMWLHLEDAGVQGLTDKLSLTVEEDQIVVWGEQWNRLGSIKILKSIRDLLETYGGQIEKFKIEGPLNEKAQKDGRVVCSFDIVLDAPEEKSTLPLTGKTFVVTGELVNFPESGPYPKRAELRKLIESMGGKLAGSVSSKTTALITNFPDSGTTKIKKAKELGIEIITEEEFIRRYLSE